MDVSIVERIMQEDMKWDEEAVSDMCMSDDIELKRRETDLEYYDENTGKSKTRRRSWRASGPS